jgi:hypothetical protein
MNAARPLAPGVIGRGADDGARTSIEAPIARWNEVLPLPTRLVGRATLKRAIVFAARARLIPRRRASVIIQILGLLHE